MILLKKLKRRWSKDNDDDTKKRMGLGLGLSQDLFVPVGHNTLAEEDSNLFTGKRNSNLSYNHELMPNHQMQKLSQ